MFSDFLLFSSHLPFLKDLPFKWSDQKNRKCHQNKGLDQSAIKSKPKLVWTYLQDLIHAYKHSKLTYTVNVYIWSIWSSDFLNACVWEKNISRQYLNYEHLSANRLSSYTLQCLLKFEVFLRAKYTAYLELSLQNVSVPQLPHDSHKEAFCALTAVIILKTKSAGVILKRHPSHCVSRHTSNLTSSHRFGGNSRGASHQGQWSSCSSVSMGSGWPCGFMCLRAFFIPFIWFEWSFPRLQN